MEIDFDNRVSKKVVELLLTIMDTPDEIVKAVMILHEGAATKMRVGSDMPYKFFVKVEVHPGSVLSPFVFNNGNRGCKEWYIS